MQKQVYVTDISGDKLSVWILTGNTDPLYIIIICHGFRGAKENSGKLIPFARKLNRLGIGVVAFDFRGSGYSDGDFASVTLSRQVADLHLIISYIKHRYRLPILLMGRSFGGSTVAAAAPFDNMVAGCIFWSVPINLHGTFGDMLGNEYYRLRNGETITIIDQFGQFSLRPDIIRDFDRHDLLSQLEIMDDIPVLVVHGGQDEVVSPDNARLIMKAVKNGQLTLVDEADHRFTDHTRAREQLTVEWIKRKILNCSGGNACI